ncbi:MAG TPA: hypothetical protein VGD94_00445 [Vicinamibacterales bacterium]
MEDAGRYGAHLRQDADAALADDSRASYPDVPVETDGPAATGAAGGRPRAAAAADRMAADASDGRLARAALDGRRQDD